jgi:hypothetical protein
MNNNDLTDSDKLLLQDVVNYGWHCVSIEDVEIPYCFSVGFFRSFQQPELIVVGLPPNVAHQFLCIAASASRKGSPIDTSQPTNAFMPDYLCKFVEVPRAKFREFAGYCVWYYKGLDFQMQHLVWPSREGLFPWDSDAPANYVHAQPIFGTQPRS